jgi:predicted nucleic acid-binding protein
MTYLLDTNVVCEATARKPEARVLAWSAANADECSISCITLGEVWMGIHLLPEGKRKQAIARWAIGIERDFAERVMALDSEVLKVWGELYARHESKGLNLDVLDSLLSATALVHDLTIATRNTRDFSPEVRTVNPWLA